LLTWTSWKPAGAACTIQAYAINHGEVDMRHRHQHRDEKFGITLHYETRNDSVGQPCNENQLDALFILSLFRQSTSTCFGHNCSPSSGSTLYIYNNWYVLCFLADCWSGQKHNTYQLYIYSRPHDDVLQICPKHVEVDWRNKLRINSASSWFSLRRFIEMHGQQNIKFNQASCIPDPLMEITPRSPRDFQFHFVPAKSSNRVSAILY